MCPVGWPCHDTIPPVLVNLLWWLLWWLDLLAVVTDWKPVLVTDFVFTSSPSPRHQLVLVYVSSIRAQFCLKLSLLENFAESLAAFLNFWSRGRLVGQKQNRQAGEKNTPSFRPSHSFPISIQHGCPIDCSNIKEILLKSPSTLRRLHCRLFNTGLLIVVVGSTDRQFIRISWCKSPKVSVFCFMRRY